MALSILNLLVTQPQSKFEFCETTYEKVYEKIDLCKCTKSHGPDKVSNLILKEAPKLMSKLICHLFNAMIKSSIFPSVYKVSRIIPLLKLGKDANKVESYRLISNLSAVEKILEGLLKYQLVIF